MKIAVIGMGHVGAALGKGWADVGHQVTFCVRDPDDSQKQANAAAAKCSIGSIQSAGTADAVLLAVPWREVSNVLELTGDLAGKIVLDCTNPVNSEFTELTIGHDTSAGEEVAKLLPLAQIVKIFNTNGSTNMANPDYGAHRVSMFYAGDHSDANQVAAQLAADIGFEPIELGPLKLARLLEPLAMTWIILARQRGWGRDFALDLVKRPAPMNNV